MPRFHVANGSYVFRQDWEGLLRELHAAEVEVAALLHAIWNADEKYWEEKLESDLRAGEALASDVQRGFACITPEEIRDDRERRFRRAGEQHAFHARIEQEEAVAYFGRQEWAAAAAATIASMTHTRLALQCLIQLCHSIWKTDGGFSDDPRQM